VNLLKAKSWAVSLLLTTRNKIFAVIIYLYPNIFPFFLLMICIKVCAHKCVANSKGTYFIVFGCTLFQSSTCLNINMNTYAYCGYVLYRAEPVLNRRQLLMTTLKWFHSANEFKFGLLWIWPDFVGCLFFARDAKKINWKKLGHLIIILIEMIFNIFNRKKIEDKCIISWLSSTSFCKLFIYLNFNSAYQLMFSHSRLNYFKNTEKKWKKTHLLYVIYNVCDNKNNDFSIFNATVWKLEMIKVSINLKLQELMET